MLILFTTLILILIIIIFSIQNADPVIVQFLSWQFTMPKVILLFSALLSGVFFATIWHTIRFINFSKLIKEFGRKIKDLEDEIKNKNEMVKNLEKNNMDKFREDKNV
ncbi:MAG: LapA family protein [Armatimonadetes bacterium]|nr:LapA family protein [Armatimonadota bacterium]